MTYPAEQSEAANRVPVGETVEFDLECASCGYNLRTLALAARCPECALPVSRSLPPVGFRFGKMATAIRVRRGLTLLGIAILLAAVGAIAVTAMLRFYYKFPLPWLRTNVCLCFDLAIGARLVALLGALWITFPFGRRGDRFLVAIGVCVLVFTAPLAVEAIIGFGVVHDRITLSAIPLAPSTITYGVLLLCGPPVHFLTWLHLLARVRRRAQIAAWTASLCALAAQTLLLGYDMWAFVGMFEKLPVLQTPVLEFALLGWNRQVVEIAWLTTLIAVWIYVRALNRAIPDRKRLATTDPEKGRPDG